MKKQVAPPLLAASSVKDLPDRFQDVQYVAIGSVGSHKSIGKPSRNEECSDQRQGAVTPTAKASDVDQSVEHNGRQDTQHARVKLKGGATSVSRKPSF